MRRVPFILAALAISALPTHADPVEDELRAALEKWKAGDAPGAHDHVRMADAKMAEMEAQGVSKAWGEVAGWELTLEDAMSMGNVLGGGISSGATYTSGDDNSMSGTIVANSPILSMMSGLISNSFMASASGATIERVAGNKKVALQHESDRWTGNLPYKNTVLITVEGPTKEDVLKVFEALHYDVVDKTLIME